MAAPNDPGAGLDDLGRIVVAVLITLGALAGLSVWWLL